MHYNNKTSTKKYVGKIDNKKEKKLPPNGRTTRQDKHNVKRTFHQGNILVELIKKAGNSCMFRITVDLKLAKLRLRVLFLLFLGLVTNQSSSTTKCAFRNHLFDY